MEAQDKKIDNIRSTVELSNYIGDVRKFCDKEINSLKKRLNPLLKDENDEFYKVDENKKDNERSYWTDYFLKQKYYNCSRSDLVERYYYLKKYNECMENIKNLLDRHNEKSLEPKCPLKEYVKGIIKYYNYVYDENLTVLDKFIELEGYLNHFF